MPILACFDISLLLKGMLPDKADVMETTAFWGAVKWSAERLVPKIYFSEVNYTKYTTIEIIKYLK